MRRSYHLVVEDAVAGNTGTLRYLHILAKGSAQREMYGIDLAQQSGLPPELVGRARAISERMRDARRRYDPTTDPAAAAQRATFDLANRLMQVPQQHAGAQPAPAALAGGPPLMAGIGRRWHVAAGWICPACASI